MKLKQGDNVMVITGSHKGKKGKILEAFPRLNRVVVEGVNVLKIHQKSRVRGKAGEIVERPMPINVSNVMMVDPKTGERTRLGVKKVDGKSIRIARKSGSELK